MRSRLRPRESLSLLASLWLGSGALGCGGGGAGADGGSGGGSQGKSFDACAIVTQADATALFGQTAKRDSDQLIVDPALLGQCSWTYEEQDSIGSTYSQNLHFRLWDGTGYNSAPSGADPLAVGQDGYVKVSEMSGIDIGWLQGGRSVVLTYFSIGATMPTNASMVEPMKMFAMEVSSRL